MAGAVADPGAVELGDMDKVVTGTAPAPSKKTLKGAVNSVVATHRLKKKSLLFKGSSLVLLWALSLLCLALGIAVFIVPASWNDLALGAAADSPVNVSCPAIEPEFSPYTPLVRADSTREPFIAAWEAYVAGVAARPEGVRSGCMPMRFPATAEESAGQYRGVVVVHHGFSSCPQEMALLGPPLAAQGYDVVFPLLPGHGNAIVFDPDSSSWLWSFLGIALSLGGLLCIWCSACFSCCELACHDADCCAPAGSCNERQRLRGALIGAAALGVLLVVSIVGYILVLAGGDDICFSLSFVDGVGPGCDGMSEYNDNLPTSASGYTAWLDDFDTTVAAQATGTLVLAGLSGGGAAALYSATRAVRADGSALYARTILFAPYLDVEVIGPALTPAINLGLGELKVDFGEDCRVVRRGAGKAGYCNYRLNRIDAMRGVGQGALAALSVPPGSDIAIVKVEGDGTVTNADITILANELEASISSSGAASISSMCVLGHVDNAHSPISLWNYIHQDVEMEWIPELICQAVDFLANGTPMPTDGVTTDGLSEDVCHTDCDLGGCSYDCVADAWFTCAAAAP